MPVPVRLIFAGASTPTIIGLSSLWRQLTERRSRYISRFINLLRLQLRTVEPWVSRLRLTALGDWFSRRPSSCCAELDLKALGDFAMRETQGLSPTPGQKYRALSPGPSHNRPAAITSPSSDARLAQRNRLLQSTLENLDDGVSVFDRDRRLVAWNSRFHELLDLPSDLGEGTDLREILRLQADRGDFKPDDGLGTVERRLRLFYEELPLVRERVTTTGRTLQIRRRAMPDGGVITLYADITEQKAAQGKIAQAWKDAELANHAKTAFLAHMSHELRTPLNAIIGFSEVICEGVLGPISADKLVEYIADIHGSGLHLLSMVNDILDLSKIEAGKLELAFEWVAIGEIIKGAASFVSELANTRHLKLNISLSPEDLIILGDERALKQIALNLLSNAIKFSHEGSVINILASQDQSGTLTLDIEDFGMGMTEDEITSALQPFGQAKPDTARTHGGTGLGLPIVKGLVDAHGGALEVKSNPGRGTLVRIRLPAHDGALKRTQLPAQSFLGATAITGTGGLAT
jgi:signal transduction histidine kinase